MLKILSGLAEGQVLQRGARGASLVLALAERPAAPLTATVRKGTRPLKGWNKRRVEVSGRAAPKARIAGIPEGGPYELVLESGKERVRVRSFYVGDVWILAGQSNMQGCGLMSGAPSGHPLLRCFSMAREWRRAEEPLHILAESPDPCHNGGLPLSREQAEQHRKGSLKGTGPALFFAHEMLKATGIPQALIPTAHGGSSMAQWAPQETLDGKLTFYGSMLASVRATGQPVAGVLWYQGESDANPAASPLYTARMKALVKAWRKDLRQPRLPWIIVQLATVQGPHASEAARHWNSIQEQQRLLPSKIPAMGMVATVDLPLDDNIHIASEGFAVLGRRLAREARRLVLGERGIRPPPRLKSISLAYMPKASANPKGGGSLVVDVAFDPASQPLRSDGQPRGFAIADAEGNNTHTIHKTTLHGNIVRLHLTAYEPSHFLHYGYGRVPACTLTDAAGHSLPVFGPRLLGQPHRFLPFVKTWSVHAPIRTEIPLDGFKAPPADLPEAEVKTYGENVFKLEGFINEHSNWSNRSGLAFFSASLEVPEAMRLEFLMGYDGPFRLWLDGKPFFTDMAGTNPCFPDESSKTAALEAGKHRITVGMDIHHGVAWGFFLRFARKGLKPAQLRAGDFAKPAYGL